MVPFRTVPALLLLLLSTTTSVCNGLTKVVETCEDLQDAFDSTKQQDVEVEIDPYSEITCSSFTTMSMNSNTLTVISSEELCDACRASVNLNEIRFEVTNGAKLFFHPSVSFVGTEEQDVNGGAVYVGEGSTARFYTNFETEDVGVRSVPEDGSDFASYELSGGCVYVDGYFRVDGDATFVRCEVGGGGESSPGPGGVMYVGGTGSVLFAGEVSMSEVSITDDEGNNGGGIYNKGKVNIKGNAEFKDLRAEAGGAIFNAKGAEFRFKSGATAIFNECFAHDEIAGAVYNLGYFKFSGPALALNSDSPAYYIGSTGYMRLSENSVFWGGGDEDGPAVQVATGGKLTGESSAEFISGSETGCATVYYEDGDVCL
ncbi:unnamed protein product [Pylaiella littoralis]